MPRGRGRKGGKKAQKNRSNKQKRLAALADLPPNANTAFVYGRRDWACHHYMVVHLLRVDRFDPFQPAHSTVPVRGFVRPINLWTGIHIETDFYYCRTSIDIGDCNGCSSDHNPYHLDLAHDPQFYLKHASRAPVVNRKVTYACGHNTKLRDSHAMGYSQFLSPWSGAYVANCLDCARPRPGMGRGGANLTSGYHIDAEFGFERTEYPGFCADCENWMAGHLEECLECFGELCGLAVEMESRSLGRE